MSRGPPTPDQRLGILVVAVLALGIAGIIGFAYREMRTAAIDAARQRLDDIARQLAALFEESVRARLGALRQIADDRALVAFLEHPDVSASSSVLERLADGESVNVTTELWNGEGKRLLIHGARPDTFSTDTLPFLRSLVSAERPAVVTPLYRRAETLRYAVLAAITNGSGTLGYVVQSQPIATTAWHRDTLSRLIGPDAAIFVGNAGGSEWSDLTTSVAPPPTGSVADTGLLAYQRPGTDGQLATARRMEIAPWIVLVELPRPVVLRPTTSFLRRAGAIAAVTFAIVCVLGWESGRRGRGWLRYLLRASEARFRSVVEASPNGMLMVDGGGTIVLVNGEVERLFGYSREELLGQSVERLVPMASRAQHIADRDGYMRRPETRQMGVGRDLYGVRKNESEIPLEIRLSPVESEGQVFVLASLVDISERKSAELELRRSNEELQRFAHVASHDLQEPLRTVTSYVQLLERRYGDKLDADAKEFIGFAVDGSLRMQRLVQDLLSLSRVGMDRKNFEWVSTEEVLDAALSDLRVAIEDSKAVIDHEPMPRVYGDAGQLRQLFSNLIANALRFHGGAPPRLEITSRSEGQEWIFGVRDHGIGIEPQYCDRIFVVFQRLHGRDEYPGTGIGLAICKKIVERHGGRIWVESKPDDGALFSFTLPAMQES